MSCCTEIRRRSTLALRPAVRILVLASAIALGGCAATIDRDGALAVVPYRLAEDGRLTVDVRLNDQGPYPFALDTGSSISIVFDELRDELQFESETEVWANIQGLVSSGRFRVFNIDRLQISSETWEDARVAVMPGGTAVDANIGGILGVDFLRRYAVGFSKKDQIVRLYPPDLVSGRSYRGWSSVPLHPVVISKTGATLYFFTINIRGQDVSAMLDLGTSVNIINSPGAQMIGLNVRRLKEDEALSGAVASTPVIARFTAPEIRTNHVRWRNEQFAVADTRIFSLLPEGDGPSAIMGFGFLGQRDFVIDFVRNRLLIYMKMDEVDSDPDRSAIEQEQINPPEGIKR
jgi:predicted aspartyl protease